MHDRQGTAHQAAGTRGRAGNHATAARSRAWKDCGPAADGRPPLIGICNAREPTPQFDRGRELATLFKDRCLIHVAGYNRGLVMRLLTGAGTPRELYARASAYPFVFGLIARAAALLVVVAFANQRPLAVAVIAIEAVPLY